MGKKKGKKGGGASKNAVDSEIMRSYMVTGSTTTIVKSDLVSKPQNFNIVQKPPRNMFTQTFWIQLSQGDTTITSNLSAPVEANSVFAMVNLNGASAYLAAFDQYCIYSVVTTYSYSTESFSSSQNVRVHTALDYDSIATIGLPALQSFSTYEAFTIAPDTSGMRYIKPCIADFQVQGTVTPVPSGVSRRWVDSGYSSVSHYGIRTILGPTPSGTVSVIIAVTAVIGLRNGI